MENNQQEVNLIDYVKLIIKGKKVIFICAVIGVLFAVAIFFLTKNVKIYESEAVIQVGAINQQAGDGQPIENISELIWKIN